MSLEYCWTKRRCHEEDEAPAEGWRYYGGRIIGSIDDPDNLWCVTRWAKEAGSTTRTETKSRNRAMSLLQPKGNFQSGKEIGTVPAYVTPQVTVTPTVTPPATTVKPKGMAWALQLLRT